MKTHQFLTICILTIIAASTFAWPPGKKEAALVDPIKNERYQGIKESYRKALSDLDKEDSDFVDAWYELLQAKEKISNVSMVWGTKKRVDAEKAKKDLSKDMDALNKEFEKCYEVLEEDLKDDLEKKHKEIEKLQSKRPSTSERMQKKRDEALAALRKQETRYEDMISVLKAAEKVIHEYTRSHRGKSRLEQIGIDSHDKTIYKYTKIVEAAYEMKDYKTDIAELEARKKENKDWGRKDEGTLKRAQSGLEKTGAKITKLIEKETKTLNRDLDKAKKVNERLTKRIESLPDDSKSRDKKQEEQWELESQIFEIEDTIEGLTKLAPHKEAKKEK